MDGWPARAALLRTRELFHAVRFETIANFPDFRKKSVDIPRLRFHTDTQLELRFSPQYS